MDVRFYGRHILMSKVEPRAERVNETVTVVCIDTTKCQPFNTTVVAFSLFHLQTKSLLLETTYVF